MNLFDSFIDEQLLPLPLDKSGTSDLLRGYDTVTKFLAEELITKAEDMCLGI